MRMKKSISTKIPPHTSTIYFNILYSTYYILTLYHYSCNCAIKNLMLFQQILANPSQIIENSKSQGQKSHIIQVYSQMIAYINKKCCQQGIRKKTGDKNLIIKVSFPCSPKTTKNGIQRG